MAKRRRPKLKIYWRDTGATRRAYGDFRAWADVGGKREPLVPAGGNLGTTDPEEAEAIYLARAAELNDLRKRKDVLGATLGIQSTARLQSYAAHHLRMKAKSGGVTDQWLDASENHLRSAVEFFGPEKELHEIRVSDVQRYSSWLQTQPVWRGAKLSTSRDDRRTLSGGSVRKYLNTLSNLFRRAQSEEVVPLGHNPVSLMMERPTAKRQEARWLEPHEAALLLESARTYQPKRADLAMPFAYPLLATFLLTGGRESEVLGLEVEDISFDRKTVTFRPNEWRRLKTLTSHRTMPLHPQLEEILREHLYGGDSPIVSGLLFPSHRFEKQAKLTDVRKFLDAIGDRAGWKPGEIRTKMFRHTYTAARLQCTDKGAPIAIFTVGRELGHGGDSLVKRVYGHLGTIRHRSESVEFRVENHVDSVAGYAERLKELAQ